MGSTIVSPQCERLRIHLFEGHVYPSGNVGGWHHIYGTNDQNSFGRIDNLVNNSDPLGYFSAHISIKDSSGNFIPKKDTNGTLIENDMFRRDWTKEELLENISLAFTNKTYTGVGNKFEGQMSDGKTITICVNGNTSVIDNTTNIKTVWPNR